MRRLVLYLLAAVCLLATPAAASAQVTAQFELPASNGFVSEVEAESEDGESFVALALSDRNQRNGHWNTYGAHGEVLATSIEVSFGRLGHFSLEFEPTSSESWPAGPGCPGKKSTTQEGFFVGDVEFRGERGFATISARRVKGTVEIKPERRCLSGLSARGAAARASRSDFGALRARADDGRVFVAAGEHDGADGGASFLAGLVEHTEGMRIGRIAYANVKDAGRFPFDHEDGTAAVRPPSPFSGRATFRRDGNAKRPGTWRGNLSVTLLGHARIQLAGPAFRAILNRNSPFGD